MTTFPAATSSRISWVWWRTSKLPPSCGYSFLIVCRQCGQAVTTFFTFFRSEDLPGRDQLADQLGVVADLEVAAQLRVLVLDRVQAVRTGGDDLLHLLRVHGLDVLLSLHLVQHFVPR